VTAAAQRAGLGTEDLDALTEALSGDAANGGADAATALIGVPRRITSVADFSRIGSGARAKLAQLSTHSGPMRTEGTVADEPVAPNADSETQVPRGFWSDPIARGDRGRNQGS